MFITAVSLIFLLKWKEEAWEKNQGFNGIRTRDLRDTGAMLYQLSYEATHWERHRGECLLFSGHLLTVLRSVILPGIIQINARRRVSLVKTNARFFP